MGNSFIQVKKGEIKMVKINEMKAGINSGTSLEVRHPNAKGTGSALRARLIIGGMPENRGVLIGIAPQKTVDGLQSAFDFGNPHCAFLGFVEVAQFLQVLRGETESIAEGKGIWFDHGDEKVIVKLEHRVEPVCGYMLRIVEKCGSVETAEQFWFTPAEALGFCEALIVSFREIAFGK